VVSLLTNKERNMSKETIDNGDQVEWGCVVNPEAQRIAIAEACGWSRCEGSMGYETRYRGTPSETTVWVSLPDYLNDLNAMHEAEKVLTEEQRIAYSDCTYDIALKAQKETGKWRWISLTAAQRAEAFLRTIGKWEEANA
jgi:hypothetical protein